MREHAGARRRRAGRASSTEVEETIADAVAARRREPLARSRHAGRWRLRRLKTTSGRASSAPSRATARGSTTSCAARAGCSCTASSACASTALENIPLEGGVVLAPMHRSYLDTLAVGVSLKKRRFRAMAKYELFFVPLIGRAIAMGGGFPVRRGVQDMEAYETAMGMLRDGKMLLVFPEGTRNRHGKARPQLGAARLALDAGAAFVPVSIAGTDRIRLVPPRFPKVTRDLRRADRARRSPGRRSPPRVAHGDQALVGGRRGRRHESRPLGTRFRRRAGRAGAGGARAARPDARRARVRPDRSRRSRT